jgi:DNA gyrase/topoisomerase IV subunit A
MIEETLSKWLDSLTLTIEQKVISEMALRLAASFDETGHTSTTAELRKTILELQSQINANRHELDPLEKLLTR